MLDFLNNLFQMPTSLPQSSGAGDWVMLDETLQVRWKDPAPPQPRQGPVAGDVDRSLTPRLVDPMPADATDVSEKDRHGSDIRSPEDEEPRQYTIDADRISRKGSIRQGLVDIPPDGRSAAVRYNNPGAQYPSERAKLFGQQGHGVIGGGHKIAYFPSEAHGAAANMDLFSRSYQGMNLGAAVAKWRGGNGSVAVPKGWSASQIVDEAFVSNRDNMVRFFAAMAAHEGRGSAGPIPDNVWATAFDWYRAGGAPPLK